VNVVLAVLGKFETNRIGQALGRDRIAGQKSPCRRREARAELFDVVLLLVTSQLGIVARIETDSQDLKIPAWDLVDLLQHLGHTIEQGRA
jgi:hypothetical protein